MNTTWTLESLQFTPVKKRKQKMSRFMEFWVPNVFLWLWKDSKLSKNLPSARNLRFWLLKWLGNEWIWYYISGLLWLFPLCSNVSQKPASSWSTSKAEELRWKDYSVGVMGTGALILTYIKTISVECWCEMLKITFHKAFDLKNTCELNSPKSHET